MKLKKASFIGLALVACFCVSACRKTSAPSEQTPANPATSADGQQPEGGVAVVVETKYFKGSIGSALDLQMKLAREGEKLTGSYYYQKVGTKIDLRGTVDKDGAVTLEEFDTGGKQSGVFKGLWKPGEDGAIEVSGNWTKPSSDKKTAFSLHEQPIEFSNGVEIVSKSIREKNKKLKYEVDVVYPQLSGSGDPSVEKFNQTVRSLVTKKVNGFKKEMTPTTEELSPEPTDETSTESLGSDITIGYEVALAKNDLISIEFTDSSYSAGAAHPNSYTEVVNFDLKNGKVIKLSDLFLPGAKYVQALATYCIQDLQKQAKAQGDAIVDVDWIKKGAAPELTNYDNWTITRKGLSITFDPYTVGPYAVGPQHVLVPYSTLKDLIKLDGPVGRL
jgi:hypothetical protein